MDAGRNARRIERIEGLVVDQHVLTARLVLELRDRRDQLPVMCEKRALGRELAGDQRFAQEDLARRRRIDGAEGNAPPRHQRQSVQGDPLGGNDFASCGVPLRIEVAAIDERSRGPFDPLGLDPRGATRIQSRRVGQLRREHPLGALPGHARTGMQEEFEPARAEVMVVDLGAAADVRQESREQRAMDRFVAGIVDLVGQRVVPAPPELGNLLGELPVQVAPFAQPQIGNVVRAALLDQLAMRRFRRKRVGEELP